MGEPGRAEALAQRVAMRLAALPGVAAVVLGGSHATGLADATSDVDLGIYYEPDTPLGIDALRALARSLDDRGEEATVTEPGAWGPWVNGGAWLVIDGTRVDWLYRDLGRVRTVIDECMAGRPTSDYTLGHPHAFHSPMYLGELQAARVLCDPQGRLEPLRRRLRPYPPALRAELVRRFLFEAAFMLEVARKPAARGDVFPVAGCLFRAAAALVQVLHAANERFCLNEKGALRATDGLARAPERFAVRVEAVLSSPGATPHALGASRGRMEALVTEVRRLCEA